MAHTLFHWPYPAAHEQSADGEPSLRAAEGIFFRALVELGTGNVAGIETVAKRGATCEQDQRKAFALPGRAALAPGGAWGRRLREGAAYLLRGDLNVCPDAIGATLGLPASRTILMFDVAALYREPSRSLDLLIACKQAGARILLDNFDLDDPPARFMEMLPADILRVSPGRMPWHWDGPRRRQALEAVLAFADNLLMDVAVEGVTGRSQRLELRRLGVRYAQGSWRREALGVFRMATASAHG
jgi:hypothetical protein